MVPMRGDATADGTGTVCVDRRPMIVSGFCSGCCARTLERARGSARRKERGRTVGTRENKAKWVGREGLLADPSLDTFRQRLVPLSTVIGSPIQQLVRGGARSRSRKAMLEIGCRLSDP